MSTRPAAESTHGVLVGPTGAPLWTRLGRFAPLLVIFQLGWCVPSAAGPSLLQSLAEDIDPDHKVAIYAVITTVGALAAVVGMLLGGTIADRARSRVGPRKPVIAVGAAAGVVGMAIASATTHTVLIVLGYAVFQLALNLMIAGAAALTPDYLHPDVLGKASGLGGLGYLIGQGIGGAIVSAAVGSPRVGMICSTAPMLLAAIVLVVWAPGQDNRHRPVREVTRRAALDLARDRDYWLVFAGRATFVLALFMLSQYGLYIGTDYLGLSKNDAGDLVGVALLAFALSAALTTVIAGVWSDRLGRRKAFVIAAPVITAVGVLPLLASASSGAVLVTFTVAGLGFGAYIAVDQALMVEVLPRAQESAKDLAVLSAANSLPLVVSPVLAAAMVWLGGYRLLFVATVVVALAGGMVITRVRSAR